ncbi:MAG: NAD-dependent epimerase/dehydratase family protein [Acidobacteria bacterium]|nr:NAD-dependent epimerase/dehydratase family protein [Acidobacteriota bacterium]
MRKNDLVVVCGAGGFIGGALVADLRRRGVRRIRAVDCKPQSAWFQRFDDVDNRVLDLQRREACVEALQGADACYNLAADMGGMGFIELNKARCMLSVLINTHLLEAARTLGVPRFFFASSACVYPGYRQQDPDIPGLAEADAYPADPEDGYGWEKLFSERMCRHFHEDFGIECRIARFHNVYGPFGTYDGGREKAPAAICRKVIDARRTGSGTIEIWGDGQQTRSFMYIDDCIEGIGRLMDSDVRDPINIGSDEMVTINQLVSVVEDIAGVSLRREYQLSAPKGVRGRSSDNMMIRRELGWAPSTSLRAGIEKTYAWIFEQMVGDSPAQRDRLARAS